ncbi:MAG: LysR family transcriptional regulator [Actinomycetota bacterium]|nr:LysR family transcriptional regulator [Actinomycetota bacterium]
MTSAQLRAFVGIVRTGSVKQAAAELGLTEQAVSMHVAQLRKSLGDQLFRRTHSGLAFTPGGLRLAARAVEILGLQDQTISEVEAAAGGQRTIRLATSSLFAEHAVGGLIDLFTRRAKDLEVELTVQPPDQFASLLASRAVDVAIGATPLEAETASAAPTLSCKEFLTYDVEVMASPSHPFTTRRVSPEELAHATWNLGPSAAGESGVVPEMLADLGVPEDCQRIFQSDAAAWEETQRGTGLTLALTFAVHSDLRAERLARVAGPGVHRRATWSAMTLAHDPTRTAGELMRFVTTPKAIQAMLRGAGVPLKSFRPAVYVTLWN